MDNLFRSFFGLGHRHRPPIREPENDLLVIRPFTSDDAENSTGMDSFLFTRPDDISRQFDEIFANFESIFQGMGVIDKPWLEFTHPGESGPNGLEVPVPPSSQLSPRDKMLKHPELSLPYQGDREQQTDMELGAPSLFGRLWLRQQTPFHEMEKEDSDLDGSIDIDKLDKMLRSPGEVLPEVRRENSVFQSVSVRTHRSADGKIEETRTTVDPHGNKQTVVTRTVDDQSIRHMTKINKRGETEVTEELFNVDEKDRSKFDERWNGKANFIESQPSKSLSQRNKVFDDFHSDGSIFSKLFGFGFPGFR